MQQHSPLPRRFYPTQNWLSSECLTSARTWYFHLGITTPPPPFFPLTFHSTLVGLLVWLPRGEGLAVDVDDRLLPQVDPEDVLLVAVLLHDGLQAAVEAIVGGLTRPENREAGKLEIIIFPFYHCLLFFSSTPAGWFILSKHEKSISLYFSGVVANIFCQSASR